jgi:hypothetical protein
MINYCLIRDFLFIFNIIKNKAKGTGQRKPPFATRLSLLLRLNPHTKKLSSSLIDVGLYKYVGSTELLKSLAIDAYKNLITNVT